MAIETSCDFLLAQIIHALSLPTFTHSLNYHESITAAILNHNLATLLMATD